MTPGGIMADAMSREQFDAALPMLVKTISDAPVRGGTGLLCAVWHFSQ
jgi:hypothetical protein